MLEMGHMGILLGDNVFKCAFDCFCAWISGVSVSSSVVLMS